MLIVHRSSDTAQVKSLDDIKDGGDYVAAANEKFKYMAYARIVSGHTRAMQKFNQVW